MKAQVGESEGSAVREKPDAGSMRRFLTEAGAAVGVEPESRLALALEGALGVGTALLAAPVQHLTLIHVCRRKGERDTVRKDCKRPRFSCRAHPKCREPGLGCCLLHFGSKEKGNLMVFFQVPAGTASVVPASEVLVN